MTDVTLPTLSSAAQALDYLYKTEQEIKSIERQLDDAKMRRRKVTVEVLPNLFDVADVTEVTLPNGLKGKKTLLIEGSLPKVGDGDTPEEAQEKTAKREAAIAWAMANGWGPFVKDTITLEFDRGDSDGAERVLDFVRGFNDHQPKVKRDQGIHAQTLQSQARKRIEQGLGIPLDDLGLTALTGVKITKRPKE